MTENEVRLIRRLYDRLQGIEQEIHSVRASQERQEQQRDVQPLWLDPILAERKQAETDGATHQEKHYRVQKSLKRATWLAFIAAVIYAGIAGYQLSEIQRQTSSIHKGAEASNATALIAKDQLEVMRSEQRPWLGMVNLSFDANPTFQFVANSVGVRIVGTLEIKNFGTVPALGVKGIATIWIPTTHVSIFDRPASGMIHCPLDGLAGNVVFPGSSVKQGFDNTMAANAVRVNRNETHGVKV